MKWECSECGAFKLAVRRPISCVNCGTAGVIFVEADQDEDLESLGDLRGSWLQAGMLRAQETGSM